MALSFCCLSARVPLPTNSALWRLIMLSTMTSLIPCSWMRLPIALTISSSCKSWLHVSFAEFLLCRVHVPSLSELSSPAEMLTPYRCTALDLQVLLALAEAVLIRRVYGISASSQIRILRKIRSWPEFLFRRREDCPDSLKKLCNVSSCFFERIALELKQDLFRAVLSLSKVSALQTQDCAQSPP